MRIFRQEDRIFRMNRKDAEMRKRKPETGDRRAESGERSAPPAPASFPVSAFRFPLSEKASALITTLLVLVVLSTICVAFMQSMSIERSVAKSVKNKLQATLAADAALDVALQRLQAITTNGPYGAIYDLDQSSNCYLYLAKRDWMTTNIVTRRIPLFSTVTPIAAFDNPATTQIDTNSQTISDLDASGAAISRTLSSSVDRVCSMNFSNSTFPNGFVGLRSGASLMPLPVNWIYLKDISGRIVGRYAFWVDDECSKIDLRFAGQPANAAGTHLRGAGTNRDELSLRVLTNAPVNLQASTISNLLALRDATNAPARSSYVQYSLPGGGSAVPTSVWAALQPYVTVYSLSDDRSPDGKRRLNLNSVVTSTNTPAQVLKEVTAIRDAITNNLPQFGLRYYSSPSAPSSADQEIYATKIAANIRDFVDTNNVATVIDSEGDAYTTNSPGFIPYEALKSDLPLAFGKEAGPFLSEYFRIVRVISPEPHSSSASPGPVVIRFAHYVELHNPTGKALNYADLGPAPFVMLANRRVWNNTSGGSPSVLRPADIKMHLPSDFSIPAGGFAVLTTDGPPFGDSTTSSAQTGYMGAASNRYTITAGTGPGQWELVNTGGKAVPSGGNYEDYAITVGAISSNRFGLQNSGPSSATYADQRERLLFGNDDGLIDYTLRIFTDRGNYVGRNLRNPSWNSTFLADDNTSSKNAPGDSASAARFTRGEVRSNTEASDIQANTSACWKEGNAGGYGNTLLAATGSGGPQQTLGSVNYNTDQNRSGVALWRQGWYEYSSDPSGNHFVANRPMGSTGELGAVYDPIRHDISGFRSQGATLRVGQSDAGTNNRANQSGADYVNWLGGRGSDDTSSTNYARNAFLLMDVFQTDDITEGRINPNSLVRDPSALAFRSVLDGFVFETSPTNQASSALSGTSLNATNAMASLRTFATNSTNGFLVSVGDLSRAPLFWTSTNALAGVSMQAVSDAGREEFMRRSANLLSTQSLAFSIYVRAEAGTFVKGISGTDRFRVAATASSETVVQLRPMYAPTTDPTIPLAPTNWSIVKPRSINY